MQCSICGAELLPSEKECAQCAENAAPTVEPPNSTLKTPDTSSPRPFAQITPYSGPYPPAYVQISSSEARPRRINILAKWVGLLWSGGIPMYLLLNENASRTERLREADTTNGGGVNLYFWIGLWAIVTIPAYLIYCFTRPKSSRKRGF